ncbi:hypothetical protein H257_08264 [Aphanomyces astaci]|uniref:Uncharacterized protein n=1 Tax=Aphanomyces astaci TaxID=112090 RepID=W4GFN6_APHAT|nr:hypothetical protein H257_08264 [Aphanomyces astaci]ETV78051.1 hypothetical protein H257_08264 [Aphanomyces astaci]|eukprot:XP_009832388.1 hypothetical protein H257_08264 [Aphanomyces astaci]
MVASPTTNVADDKRRFECLRKRRYRAAKRSELKMLEEEVGDLMARLRFMQAKYYSTALAPPQSAPRLRHRLLHHPPHPVNGPLSLSSNLDVAKAVHRHTAVLRAQVVAHRNLVRTMAMWVASPPPHLPHCLSIASRIHVASLTSDQHERTYALEWLSERVFHSAMAAMPQHPFATNIADSWKLHVHRRHDDTDDDTTIEALESHCQFTVFAALDDVAKARWPTSRSNSLYCHQVVASVHERLVYFTHYNYRLGTTSLTISGRFQHGSRVVVAHMLVAHDECLPLAPGDLRPYGFGWTVYEPVSHGITLVRYSMLQCTPLTSQSTVMTLNEIGRLFGLPSRGAESADAYVDAIAAAAEENLVRTHMPAIRGFCLDLEKSDVDENSGA